MRTNNVCESFNNYLRQYIRKIQPACGFFVHKLKNFESGLKREILHNIETGYVKADIDYSEEGSSLPFQKLENFINNYHDRVLELDFLSSEGHYKFTTELKVIANSCYELFY